MATIKYKGYEGTTELDMEEKACRGKILFINDLVTYKADCPATLQASFEAAVDDYIETCALIGKEPQKPFKGIFNVRITPELHREVATLAEDKDTTINDIVASAIKSFITNERCKMLFQQIDIHMESVEASTHIPAFLRNAQIIEDTKIPQKMTWDNKVIPIRPISTLHSAG